MGDLTAEKTQSNTSREDVGKAFIAVLLALVLKATLDSFFKRILEYRSAYQIGEAFCKNPSHAALLLFQLAVFLFTIVRFYLGSSSYYREKARNEGVRDTIVDIVGLFLLFISFYVTSLFVGSIDLFYWGLAFMHLFDLGWFLVAGALLHLDKALQKVAAFFKLFDFVSAVGLFLLLWCRHCWGPTKLYIWQWLSLALLTGIGVWDVVKLRLFYQGKSDWKEKFVGN